MPFIDVLRRCDLMDSKEQEDQRRTIVSRISNYISNWATSVSFEKVCKCPAILLFNSLPMRNFCSVTSDLQFFCCMHLCSLYPSILFLIVSIIEHSAGISLIIIIESTLSVQLKQASVTFFFHRLILDHFMKPPPYSQLPLLSLHYALPPYFRD